MTPDEILIELNKKGINISRRTLLRYEKDELIPEPARGGNGRGKGRVTEYPQCAIWEACAAWYLIKEGYTKKEIAKARKDGFNTINYFWGVTLDDYIEYTPKEEIAETEAVFSFIKQSEYDWIMTYNKAKSNINFDKRIHIIYYSDIPINKTPPAWVWNVEDKETENWMRDTIGIGIYDALGMIGFYDKNNKICFVKTTIEHHNQRQSLLMKTNWITSKRSE